MKNVTHFVQIYPDYFIFHKFLTDIPQNLIFPLEHFFFLRINPFFKTKNSKGLKNFIVMQELKKFILL